MSSNTNQTNSAEIKNCYDINDIYGGSDSSDIVNVSFFD